ncbi:MAG: enoyl-CoA hydratase/isomerase family protein [Bacteroidetes bacterium]|nr:enoyl-CoA hydratase/isomerase family protein [Bacteroidota bacterium]
MSDFKNLILSLEEGILTITISRPESLNALNSETINEIHLAFQEALDEEAVKGIIVTGAGDKAFVAGADIKEIAELNELNGRKFSENGQEVFNTIENCEKPVIAAVNGFALGGGCELAMACHIRIASENARFGQPEVKLGIIPGYGGTQRLTQLAGKGKALELMMTGEMISAGDACELGLVNHVVSQETLIEFSRNLMKKIMEQAPMAVANVIGCVNAAFRNEENGYQTEANSFSNCCRTDDFKEGTTAFIEKKKPEFKGS